MKPIEKFILVMMYSAWRRPWLGLRVAAAVEHYSAMRGLDIKTVVDLGANRGQFALLAKRCFPESKVYSFEPLPGPARVFRKVFLGDPTVKLSEAAIGPTQGHVEIHVSRRDDSSSLLPISDLQSSTYSGTEEVGTISVLSGLLSDFLSADCIAGPALLKLDVQGFELAALKASEDLFHQFDRVYVECSFVQLYCGQALSYEVIDFLRLKGFVIDGIYNVSYNADGAAIQADFLFKRSAV